MSFRCIREQDRQEGVVEGRRAAGGAGPAIPPDLWQGRSAEKPRSTTYRIIHVQCGQESGLPRWIHLAIPVHQVSNVTTSFRINQETASHVRTTLCFLLRTREVTCIQLIPAPIIAKNIILAHSLFFLTQLWTSYFQCFFMLFHASIVTLYTCIVRAKLCIIFPTLFNVPTPTSTCHSCHFIQRLSPTYRLIKWVTGINLIRFKF